MVWQSLLDDIIPNPINLRQSFFLFFLTPWLVAFKKREYWIILITTHYIIFFFNKLYYLISIQASSSCCRHYSMANYHYHDSRNVTVSKSFHIIFYYLPTRLITNPNLKSGPRAYQIYLIPSSKNGFRDEPKCNAL